MNKYDEIRSHIDWLLEEVIDESDNKEESVEVILPINKDNVISGDRLRLVQSITLNNTKNFLAKTFGPMGSNTKIIMGDKQSNISSKYSKDGLKVLSNIINSGPVEASIVDELVEITRAVEKEVGDGTTSTVILSSLIFDRLMKIEKRYNVPPFQLIRIFENIVEEIKQDILSKGRDCTIDDIYNITMISTNGNEEVANNIKDIYKEFGMDVELSVGISNNSNTAIKIYDGLTITEGISDPVFINNKENNTCEIHDAHIYHFTDPIDTMDMIVLFEAILNHNIYEPLSNEEECIPTVITCPKLSKDMSVSLKKLANYLYSIDNAGAAAAKPPILIISNVIASDEIIMSDIANLCDCKSINKYIDAEILKKDQEEGKAPTVENVHEFCGKAELVVADMKKTKFINPVHMNGDENDPIYNAMINFLETEIEQAKSTENAHEIGLLKKRLSALKANMVDYLVGGVTVADRDATKDLVEDAIKNCKSSSLYGVGHAANYEGLTSSYKIYESYKDSDDLRAAIAGSIFDAYCEVAEILYGSVELDKEKVKNYIYLSIENGYPWDISNGFLPSISDLSGNNVLCSIKLDCNILDTLSKIITIMVTCNQCLLQSPHLNIY